MINIMVPDRETGFWPLRR